MRWAKIIGLLVAGAIVGSLLTGFAVFEYMKQIGVDWNQWAASERDESKVADAMMTLGSLKSLRAEDVDGAEKGLESRLNSHIYELALMKRTGHDPKGDTSKALSAIAKYRETYRWTSGNPEVDKLTTNTLSEAISGSSKDH